MQNPEIVIIGAAIIDVLAYPVNVKVFETGSYSTEDIHMTTGADALNEATILAKKGRRVQLEQMIGQDDAGKSYRLIAMMQGSWYGMRASKKMKRQV